MKIKLKHKVFVELSFLFFTKPVLTLLKVALKKRIKQEHEFYRSDSIVKQ